MSRWNPTTRHRDSVSALFDEAGRNVARAGVLLGTVVEEWWARGEVAGQIRQLEHNGDRITHELLFRLQRSVTLRFDPGAAYELAWTVDDVLDYIDEAAEHIVIYKVGAPSRHAIELAGLIRESTRELAAELRLLAKPAQLGDGVKRIDALLREARRALRAERSRLFAQETDASLVLRWKDILDRLGYAIDSCHQAAMSLETIRVKNGR